MATTERRRDCRKVLEPLSASTRPWRSSRWGLRDVAGESSSVVRTSHRRSTSKRPAVVETWSTFWCLFVVYKNCFNLQLEEIYLKLTIFYDEGVSRDRRWSFESIFWIFNFLFQVLKLDLFTIVSLGFYITHFTFIFDAESQSEMSKDDFWKIKKSFCSISARAAAKPEMFVNLENGLTWFQIVKWFWLKIK